MHAGKAPAPKSSRAELVAKFTELQVRITELETLLKEGDEKMNGVTLSPQEQQARMRVKADILLEIGNLQIEQAKVDSGLIATPPPVEKGDVYNVDTLGVQERRGH